MPLKEKDQKNLDALLAFLEANKMRGELRGSAVVAKAVPNESKKSVKYHDLDLNVWDAEEKGPGYHSGRKAIDNFLNKIGINKFHFTPSVAATCVEGRWEFEYKGTKFDVVYTPTGPSFLGYVAVETQKKDVKKKKQK